MNPRVSLEREDAPGADAAVRDYDELDGAAKVEFPALVAGDATLVTDDVAAGLSDGEIVRYDRYYRVSIGE